MERGMLASCTDHCVMPMGVPSTRPRPLTHDEKKAAEAAFQGAPFNPDWSVAAQKVYEGLTAAMDKAAVGGRPASARLFT